MARQTKPKKKKKKKKDKYKISKHHYNKIVVMNHQPQLPQSYYTRADFLRDKQREFEDDQHKSYRIKVDAYMNKNEQEKAEFRADSDEQLAALRGSIVSSNATTQQVDRLNKNQQTMYGAMNELATSTNVVRDMSKGRDRREKSTPQHKQVVTDSPSTTLDPPPFGTSRCT